MAELLPPHVEAAVTVRDGRKLGIAQFGPHDGRPVLWFHGTPGGRRQVPQAARALAEEEGLRVIGVDRPGIGLSTPHLYPSVYDFTGDLVLLLEELDIDRLAVVGMSGGGPYALATAHALRDRVVAAAVLGGVAPTVGDEAVGGGVVGRMAPFQAVYPALRRPVERVARFLISKSKPLAPPIFDVWAHFSAEGDRRIFADPAIKAMFLDDLSDNGAVAIHAPIFDLILFLRHWGFAVADIEVPVRWWHGDADHIVPLEHGRHTVSLIPGAELRVRPGESHLSGLGAAEEVLVALNDLWEESEAATSIRITGSESALRSSPPSRSAKVARVAARRAPRSQPEDVPAGSAGQAAPSA